MAIHPAFLRREALQNVGLEAGCLLPIPIGREVVGILEFYASGDADAPDTSLLEVMAQIGVQIGRVVERQRATEQLQRQQEALVQSEKLAAMGSLLASVAHELNNPLSIAMMEAELLSEDAAATPLAEHADKIVQATTRCGRIVQNFLALARQHPPERARVELNAIVEETVELLAYPLRIVNIEVQLDLADDLPVLWADPHQLRQVAVNLITNAHQALRETTPPRRLTLTTRRDPGRNRVRLEVADTGPGIPLSLQARIFEPFFTTKPTGVGTGLGLSLCRGIIESHGGSLRVQSQPGQGTRFSVDLPVEQALVAEAATPPLAASERPSGQEKAVLIIDDERGVRSALAYLLRRDGYRVETAENGLTALAKLQSQAFDLILCDLRMPELDGIGFYHELETQHPQLLHRLVLLTGDTLDPETQAFLEHVTLPRLSKPFTATELRRVLHRAL